MTPVVELVEHPAALVVRLSTRPDATMAGQLRPALTAAVERHPAVVVDLAAAHTLDDTSLGLLVRAHRNARKLGGVVCLAAPSRVVMTVLHTMKVDGLFPLFDSCEAALDHLSGGPSADLRLKMFGEQFSDEPGGLEDGQVPGPAELDVPGLR
jgi:anti-anti-sigma factor